MALSLALVQFKIFIVMDIIGWVIPVLLVVLGIETVLNVVLDIYRPRLKDQYSRAAFDSRLLGVINEPGGILRSAADAIDYQFGFNVSQTWFYKLLEKAIAPLVLFAAVILYLLSCIVVVAPNEQAVIERFGNPLTGTGEKRIAEPGFNWKWPWPIDTAYIYPTKRISEISIGFVPKADQVNLEPLLWGETHYQEEYSLLVASEQTSEASAAGGAVPVSLLIAAVPVQYRIKDLYSFLYNYGQREKRDGTIVYEAEEMLKSICYRELTMFAASAKIEVDDTKSQDGLQQSLLGAGRADAKRILTDRIQQAADKAGLGVEIMFLGLQGIHPPPTVASAYQQVVGAVQKKQALILHAQAQRNMILTTLVGSIQDANELYSLATQYQQAKRQGQSEKVEELAADLDLAFTQARGEIYQTLRGSQSYAFEVATLAEATGLRFASQLKAYRAAERIYKHRLKMAVLEEALGNIRKYVVVADPNDTQIFIVDITEKRIPSLYELGGYKESGK